MDGTVRVLCVDTADAAARTAAELADTTDGLEAVPESDPDEAIERVQEGDTDCVVATADPPGTDALALLERVRADRPELPVVFYADETPGTLASDVLSAGATDYLVRSGGAADVERLANRVVNAVEQARAVDRARRRERVADLVRTTQSELVRARTREDIDTAVCETLAGTEPYVFAWIGEYDGADGRVRPRASAGIGTDYLDEIEVAVDGATGEGPTGAAVRSGSLQVQQRIAADPAYEPWRESALERGYRSSAAVPLEYKDTLYGVLNVYTDREGAFDDEKRTLLVELGETIAHAYHRVAIQREYEAQYAELFEEAPVMFAITNVADGEPVIEDCNQRFADRLGYPVEELVGRPLSALYTERSTTDLIEEGGYERALGGTFRTEEREFYTRDGERVTTLLRASPRRDTDGTVVGTNAMYVDITERRRAEEALQQVEAMESSMDGVAIVDEDDEYVYANQAHADIYGYDGPGAFVGNTWRMCYDERAVERFESEILPDVAETGQWRGEARGRRRDGTTFPQEVSLTALDDGGLVCVVRDVTDRRERERELERSRTRLRALFESSPVSVAVHDADGHVLDVNQQTVENLGYTREQLRSMRVTDYEVGHSLAELRAVWTDLDVGERRMTEGRHRRQDGSTFPVEVWVTKTELDGEDRFIALGRDITERREYERRLKAQRDDLEVLNQVVRHDIRNDLQMTLSWAEMLEDHVDEEGSEYVDRVLASAKNAVDLTRTARELADTMLRGADELEPTSLRRALETRIDEVEQTRSTAIVRAEGTLPNVQVRANDMLDSVFRNLLQNAVQHNDADLPEVVVSVEERESDVVVRVADNGPGVPDDQKERIFGEKEKGLDSQGTGLGLYLVETLVERYGGAVRVEDNDPRGAVFVVELPTVE